jgi:hypothetical protein
LTSRRRRLASRVPASWDSSLRYSLPASWLPLPGRCFRDAPFGHAGTATNQSEASEVPIPLLVSFPQGIEVSMNMPKAFLFAALISLASLPSHAWAKFSLEAFVEYQTQEGRVYGPYTLTVLVQTGLELMAVDAEVDFIHPNGIYLSVMWPNGGASHAMIANAVACEPIADTRTLHMLDFGAKTNNFDMPYLVGVTEDGDTFVIRRSWSFSDY